MSDGARSAIATHRTWRAPLVLAILGLLGLMSALLGDGIWDMVSWIALGTPLVVIGWCWRRAAVRPRP